MNVAHRQKHDTDSSATTSTTTVNPAVQSSNASRNDGDSSMSSPKSSQKTLESTGETSSSSEESDDSTSDEGESESDDDIATVKPGSKPNFSARVAAGAPSLEDRLKSFLPQLAEANNKLQQGGANGFSMEDVKEDEPHIEMNLGLGVLKEMNGKDGEEADSSEDEGYEDDVASPERKRREKDIMGKLMGGREKQAASIQEIG